MKKHLEDACAEIAIMLKNKHVADRLDKLEAAQEAADYSMDFERIHNTMDMLLNRIEELEKKLEND